MLVSVVNLAEPNMLRGSFRRGHGDFKLPHHGQTTRPARSEEHTSELQSRLHLVCRLLLEKKNKELSSVVGEMISGGHPKLRRMVADSHPATVSLLPIRTSVPIAPCPTTTITLLRDSVHSM